MKHISIKDMNIIHDIPPILQPADRCAIDSEWFHMDKKRLHRPHGDFACATFCFNDKDIYIINDISKLKQALKNVNEAVLIFANAKFDVGQFRRFVDFPDRKKLWDIILIEQIMYSGLYDLGDFSLADIARRTLGIYMDKSKREEFQSVDSMTDEMIQYACLDTLITYKIYQEQRKIINTKCLNVWKDIDLGALWAVLAMQGLKLDTAKWKDISVKSLAIATAIQEKYPSINLNSPKQVLEYSKLMGLNITNTNEDTLCPYENKSEFIRDLLEFRGKAKQASTYGEAWVEKYIEEDGRVYSDFRINGAESGRLSSASPNVENIPVKDTKEFRECFIEDGDYIYVDADFSAQEPRIAAYQSQDEKLIQIFKSKKDIYIEAAKIMFNWDIKDKNDPRRNKQMKPTILGASYGITPIGLERKDQIPKKEGKILLDTFESSFPDFAHWKYSQQKIRTYVETVYGRRFWINPYFWGGKNNTINFPVQGTAADILKISAYKLTLEFQQHPEWNAHIVNQIHDEILTRCLKNYVANVMQATKRIMLETAEECHQGIPAEIEILSGQNWAECH